MSYNNNNYENSSSSVQQQAPILPTYQQQLQQQGYNSSVPSSSATATTNAMMNASAPPFSSPSMTTGAPPLMNFHMQPPGIYTSFNHGTGTCNCPACVLAQRYAVVYQKQFPAMTPESAEAFKINQAIAKNKQNAPCEMWSAFGFCFHGITCMFPHKDENNNNENYNNNSASSDAERASTCATYSSNKENCTSLREKSVAEICKEIRVMIDEHANDVFRCRVCGYDKEFDPSCIIKVGEMYSYMTCPQCTSPLYQPLTLYLVEAVLRETGGQDHIAYKNLIDKLRSELPHTVRIPLSFEGHRLASTYFGWSLVGPEEAAEAMQSAIAETPMPEACTLLSMGSGTGYIEHVFAEAISNVLPKKLHPKTGEPVISQSKASSFSVLAFDEILRESRFSVPVQMGTPDVMNSLPDPKNSILLLCWPPFGSPGGPQATMGYDVLRRFVDLGGECVIYIGDVASTGDYDFHVLLQDCFKPCPAYRTRHDVRRWIPQEMGLVYAGNDTIGVYKRRHADDGFAYFAH